MNFIFGGAEPQGEMSHSDLPNTQGPDGVSQSLQTHTHTLLTHTHTGHTCTLALSFTALTLLLLSLTFLPLHPAAGPALSPALGPVVPPLSGSERVSDQWGGRQGQHGLLC